MIAPNARHWLERAREDHHRVVLDVVQEDADLAACTNRLEGFGRGVDRLRERPLLLHLLLSLLLSLLLLALHLLGVWVSLPPTLLFFGSVACFGRLG